MADEEKFSLLKFIKSFFEAKPWIKTLRFGLGLIIIFLIGLTIYRAYIMPRTTNNITAAEGSTVNIDQRTFKQKRISPFIEPYYDMGLNGRKGIGAKVGVTFWF